MTSYKGYPARLSNNNKLVYTSTRYHKRKEHPRKPTSPSVEGARWTCEQEPYRYPLNEAPKDHWERCFDVVDKHDKELCEGLKEELSTLLIVSSLFLAVVTAFTIESFKWLEEDKEDTIIGLLNQTASILNDSRLQGTAQAPKPFQPDPQDIVINLLWFLSMLLSMFAVLVGTFCLQWIAAFRKPLSKRKRHDDALALRQLRYEGFVKWGVPNVAAVLLVIVQGAVVLFAIGLLFLLWSVNNEIGLAVAAVTGFSTFLLVITTLAPMIQSTLGWMIPRTLLLTQCPFKSPLSWFIQHCCLLMAVIASLIFGWWTPVVRWRKEQLSRQSNEEYWRQMREKMGPQKKSTSPGFSYYLARGLGYAMEMLIYKRDAIHVVHSCLQDFHGRSGEGDSDIETFRMLFHKQFNGGEARLLELKQPEGVDVMKQKHLRKDFLNAIALEFFVQYNFKLHRVLLPHRLELFVRIINTVSMTEGRQDDEWIGQSISCPIAKERDAQNLSTDLKIQFLQSIDSFLQINSNKWLIKNCLEGAWTVIATVGIDKKIVEPAQSEASEIFPLPGSSAPMGDLDTFEKKCKSLLETMAKMQNYWPDNYDVEVLRRLRRRIAQSKLAPTLPEVFRLQPQLQDEKVLEGNNFEVDVIIDRLKVFLESLGNNLRQDRDHDPERNGENETAVRGLRFRRRRSSY